jgi:hypothetical protein
MHQRSDSVTDRLQSTLHVAFPNADYLPLTPSQGRADATVACTIGSDLRHPISRVVSLRKPAKAGLEMPAMPKVSINEDGNPLPREYDVRLPRHLSGSNAKAKAECVQVSPQRHFRFRIALAARRPSATTRVGRP